MFNIMRVFFAALFLFSGFSFAEDDYYKWKVSVTGLTADFESAAEACNGWIDHINYQTTFEFSLSGMTRVTESQFRCAADRKTISNGNVTPNATATYVNRTGSLCADDFEYNADTGECVPPPHQCEVGDVIGPYKYSGYLSGGFVITDPEPPISACKNSCEYSRKSKSSGCQTGHFGTFCSYEYVGTGADCTASPENDMGGDSGEGPNANEGGDGGDGSGDGGDGGDNNDSDPQDDVPEAPPSSNAEGDAKESTLQEVKSVLGTLSKESTSKKIESGINKGNTLLQGIKDAIGNISGGGTGSGNGDGDEDSESVAVVGSCSDALECSGDAIQCAILQVQKNQLCQYQITPEVEQQIQSIFEGEENQLETKDIEVGSLFTDGLNAARWLPTSCPVPESVTVFGRSYSISWEPLCTFASALSALIVAMASIFFIVYLGKGLKGS